MGLMESLVGMLIVPFFFNSFGSNLWVRLFNHLLIWLLLVVTDIMDTDFFF